jgi:hypothetical protein
MGAAEASGERATVVSALLIAFVAGGFSLLGLIIAKEQKTSEFRQAWIDALREDIALYCAKVAIVQAYIDRAVVLDADKLFEDNREEYIAINQSALRIKLRLNASESESDAILRPLKVIEGKLNAEFADIKMAMPDISAALKKLEKDAPPLLKTEWERVKRGELTYRVAKLCAAMVFVICLVVAGWSYYPTFRMAVSHVWTLPTPLRQTENR